MYLPLAAGPTEVSAAPAAQQCRRHLRKAVYVCSCLAFATFCGVVSHVRTHYVTSSFRVNESLVALASAPAATSGFGLGFLVAVALVVIGAVAYLGGTRLVSRSLHKFMEHYDQEVLGVDVIMDKVELQVMKGRFHVTGLKMYNPEGFKQKYYFLDVEEAFIDIDLYPFIQSRGNTLEIKHISLKNTTVHLEKNASSSNLQTVLNNLQECQRKYDPRAPKPKGKRGKQRIILHKVDIVGLKVQIRAEVLGKTVKPPRVGLKDVHFEDLEKERGSCLTDDIGAFLLGNIITSSMVDSKAFLETAVLAAKQTLDSSVSSAKESAKDALGDAKQKATEVRETASQLKDSAALKAVEVCGKATDVLDTASMLKDSATSKAVEVRGKATEVLDTASLLRDSASSKAAEVRDKASMLKQSANDKAGEASEGLDSIRESINSASSTKAVVAGAGAVVTATKLASAAAAGSGMTRLASAAAGAVIPGRRGPKDIAADSSDAARIAGDADGSAEAPDLEGGSEAQHPERERKRDKVASKLDSVVGGLKGKLSKK